MLIAEEENFAFSYNITSLNAAMRKALNRERTNVGRSAYTERVKQMLLRSASADVATSLAHELAKLQSGMGADEVKWKDVAVHACKILNASGSNLFVTAEQRSANASLIGHALDDRIEIITLPDNIHAEVIDATDVQGETIRHLGMYQEERNDSFI